MAGVAAAYGRAHTPPLERYALCGCARQSLQVHAPGSRYLAILDMVASEKRPGSDCFWRMETSARIGLCAEDRNGGRLFCMQVVLRLRAQMRDEAQWFLGMKC
jgi:hypothetical protein